MSNLGGSKISKIVSFLITVQLMFGGSFTVLPIVAHAATGVPQVLAYQGRLTDSNGNLLGSASGTTYYFKFSIWDNATAGSGTRLWPSSSPSVASSSVASGVFNVNIGDTDGGYPDTLDYNFQDNKNVFLQVEVSSDNSTFETLSPRQRVTSAGFAINAGTVLGFAPSQSPTGSNIPVLNSGNLLLAGTNPQLNATSTNTLTLQGGTGTGNIQFFNASNTLTSAGNLTITGVLSGTGLSFTNATGTGNLQIANLAVTASTTFGGVAYTWPSTSGTTGYVLGTDGAGRLTWVPDQT
ncbi:MAG: hypothetical protein QG628_411, partial [Patescibacteria group bacterium]|nr:hypothetical protein [Patescibacteria group bacterium]